MAKKKTARKRGKAAANANRPGGELKRSGMLMRRADLGAEVGVFFATLDGVHRKIAEKLHALVTKAAPKATHAIKWGMPVYEYHGMLCYIRVQAKYVTLGFYFSGTRLKDPKGLLTGTGANMRHVKLALDEPVPEKEVLEFVKQAVRINVEDAL